MNDMFSVEEHLKIEWSEKVNRRCADNRFSEFTFVGEQLCFENAFAAS